MFLNSCILILPWLFIYTLTPNLWQSGDFFSPQEYAVTQSVAL